MFSSGRPVNVYVYLLRSFQFLLLFQISATDPDCGVNAMVNYTLAEGYARSSQFEIKSVSGEVCISGDLDFETRSSYEFPVIATDRGWYKLK